MGKELNLAMRKGAFFPLAFESKERRCAQLHPGPVSCLPALRWSGVCRSLSYSQLPV